jgi:hypothetical protein
MKFQKKLAVLTATIGLGLTPGLALAVGPPAGTPGAEHFANTPAAEHQPTTAQGPESLPPQAKAYGRSCQGQSKKRSDAAPGTKGTPFSQCVKALAQANREDQENQGGEETS